MLPGLLSKQWPVGMAGPPRQIPTPGVPPLPVGPMMNNHMMPPGQFGEQAGLLAAAPQPGQYQAQAQHLAGLLGGGGQTPPLPVGMAPPYTPRLFMPGFQPGIDTPAMGRRSQGSPARRVRPY